MLDIPFKITQEQYEALESLLTKGTFDHESFSVDFSEVQTMELTGGALVFNPPAKLQAQAGPLNIKTTITEVKVKKRGVGIIINVDNSPVDVEISPQ